MREQHLAQLNRRVEIELAAGQLVALALEPIDFLGEFLRDDLERVAVDADAGRFHLGEDRRDRHLDFVVHRSERVGFQTRRQRFAKVSHQRRIGARRSAGAKRSKVLVIKIGERRLAFARIDQKARKHRVEVNALERDSVPRERFDLVLQIVTRFRRQLGAENRRRARDPVTFDDDRRVGARELQGFPARVGFGEINRDTGCARQGFERVGEVAPGNGGGRLRRRFETGQVGLRRRDLANDRIELQLAQQLGRRLLVHSMPREFVGLDLERHVSLDTHQFPREVHRCAMLGEQARDFLRTANPRLLDMIEVLVNALHAAELLHQRRRRLLADAGHAFDIVDGVAGQRLDIDQRRRLDAEALAHLARPDSPIAHRVP